MTNRSVVKVLTGQPTSDGGGVRLTRVVSPETGLDPFLLLDEFDSSDADDYLAGFPTHPHRGFETVTYMLDGHMLHEDHLGNRGDLEPGAVQWMTAGRGIIHSEMPQQIAGRMRGFQLWINLPAADKMKPAAYQDLEPERMPRIDIPGGQVTVVAGTFRSADAGPVTGPIDGGATQPMYFDLALGAAASSEIDVPAGHRLLAYVFEGEADIAGERIGKGMMAVLGDGTAAHIVAGAGGARVLVLGGRPLGEPVVHYGPFVMNSVAEIHQAIRDYQSGHLAAPA
jgi:redox-sensitive bicupin YhaK (pirin superfamily)